VPFAALAAAAGKEALPGPPVSGAACDEAGAGADSATGTDPGDGFCASAAGRDGGIIIPDTETSQIATTIPRAKAAIFAPMIRTAGRTQAAQPGSGRSTRRLGCEIAHERSLAGPVMARSR
jgi:hypothetical protein